MPTGSWTRVLQSHTVTDGESSSTLYDYKARPVRNFTRNYLGGYTQIDSKLDFMGKTIFTETRHKRTPAVAEILVREDFTYTAQDRPQTHTHKVNNSATQTLSDNQYTAIGQLKTKLVGKHPSTGSPLQSVDYKYNIRGWLTDINDINSLTPPSGVGEPKDLFSFKINYNNPQGGGAGVVGLFNGNISETYWRTADDDIKRNYGYKYDNLNRLTEAIYQKPGIAIPNSYKESLQYDKNGNITSLQRNGGLDGNTTYLAATEIDNLTYTYAQNSNQLMGVFDQSLSYEGFQDGGTVRGNTDYFYDNNGNLLKDGNKRILNIAYNHLNLPTKIIFETTGTIQYLYSATGQKLDKKVTQTNSTRKTDYLTGGFQYQNDVLQFFPHAEGYVKLQNNVYKYVFNYTDHLGNIRLSYADSDGNGRLGDEYFQECTPAEKGSLPKCITYFASPILEENNYYPFGMKHKGYNNSSTSGGYKYKYNGKELQDELGLNMYDYGARNYDPALGRWMNIDPLAETSRRFSPFAYALNNPVYFIDPDGMQATYNWAEHDKGNKGVYTDGDKNVSFETALSQATGSENSSESNSDEPPVSFFGSQEKGNFLNTFKEKNKVGNYKYGDGVYDVYGHGGVDGNGDGWFSDTKLNFGGNGVIGTAEEFDKRMASVSAQYKKLLEKGVDPTIINLYLCQSATGDNSMAKNISKNHPNSVVVGYDGFVMYGNSKVVGISSSISTNNNEGYRVEFKNGKETSRMLYSDFLKIKK